MHSCSPVDEVEFGWCGGVDGLIFRVPIAFVGGLRQASAAFRAAVVSLGRFDGRPPAAIDAALPPTPTSPDEVVTLMSISLHFLGMHAITKMQLI